MRRRLICAFTFASLIFAAIQLHVFTYDKCCVEATVV